MEELMQPSTTSSIVSVCQNLTDWLLEPRYILGVMHPTASRPWTRPIDQPSSRDGRQRGDSLETWLNQLWIEMDELTELAKFVADGTDETIRQSRNGTLPLSRHRTDESPPMRHRRPSERSGKP
jgi:hypothetical protein